MTESRKPRMNQACAQGAHETCDLPIGLGGAGGAIFTGGWNYGSQTVQMVPCECPHHSEADS